jgi:hypothetical protein
MARLPARLLSCSVLLAVVIALGPSPGETQVPLEWSPAGTDLRVVREGNTLLARGLAPVSYSQVADMLNDLSRPLKPAAMRLTRVAPGQLVEYFFCVTLEGRLVVGQQVWREDPSRRWVFERGELARAYSPLESGGPWTWLIDVPLARESEAAIVVRAEGEWPLRSVSINLLRAP